MASFYSRLFHNSSSTSSNKFILILNISPSLNFPIVFLISIKYSSSSLAADITKIGILLLLSFFLAFVFFCFFSIKISPDILTLFSSKT